MNLALPEGSLKVWWYLAKFAGEENDRSVLWGGHYPNQPVLVTAH